MAYGISQLENRDWNFKKDVQVSGILSTISKTGRVTLTENWKQLPGANTDVGIAYNVDFELLGTNATEDDATYASTLGMMQLQTDGADDDQVILLPHLDSEQSAWTGYKWGTENQVIWETIVRTGASVASILLWAGLKLTNTPTIATDADQAFFRFSTDDSDTYWECVSSIGGTDTNTASTVTVAVNTTYHLKITIDGDRKATFWINGNAVTTTSALTDDVDLIPYVGVQALTGAAKLVNVGPTSISRVLYE